MHFVKIMIRYKMMHMQASCGGEAVNPLISLQLTLSPDWIGSKGRGERHGIMACLSDHSGDDDQCPGSHFYSVWRREWAWLIGDYKKHTNPIKLSKVKQAPGLPLINKYKLFMVGLVLVRLLFTVVITSWREKEACTSQLCGCTGKAFS